MPTPFDTWDFTKATGLLTGRRSKEAVTKRLFRDGDHWQNGGGWAGQFPPSTDPNYPTIVEAIQQNFQSENVIEEVVERHIDGVLGREPFWDIVPADVPTERQRRRARLRERFRRTIAPPAPPALGTDPAPAPKPPTGEAIPSSDFMTEADNALVNWWDETDVLTEVFEKFTDMLLLEEKALLRVYITGERGEDGSLPEFKTLEEALEVIRVEVLSADKGGVFRDKGTQRKVAVCQFEQGENNTKEQFVELSYLDENGDTVFRVMNREGKTIAESKPPYRLGGRLLIYEGGRKALISNQICQNNRAINLALTKLQRNVNVAGDLERIFLNTETPGTWVDAAGKEWVEGVSTGEKTFLKGPYKTGGGVTNFLKGIELYDAQGEPTGRADPSVTFREPVDVGTFSGTRDQFYEVILGQCRQRHALISGDATASGRSREQARAEFEKSLKRTKTVLDGAGRWLLMVVLLLAAELCNRVDDFQDLRAEFDALVEAGPLSPEERKELREDVKENLLSSETYMSHTGVDDPDAEAARVAQNPRPKQEAKAPKPGNDEQ